MNQKINFCNKTHQKIKSSTAKTQVRQVSVVSKMADEGKWQPAVAAVEGEGYPLLTSPQPA